MVLGTSPNVDRIGAMLTTPYDHYPTRIYNLFISRCESVIGNKSSGTSLNKPS